MTDEVDARTDLWAVGRDDVHAALRAARPRGRDGRGVADSRGDTAGPPSSQRRAGGSPRVADVVDRALAFDKHDRWPDAASMQKALARAVSDPLDASLALERRPSRAIRLAPPGPWSSSDPPPARRHVPRAHASRRRERRRSSATLLLLSLCAAVAGIYAAAPNRSGTWAMARMHWPMATWRAESNAGPATSGARAAIANVAAMPTPASTPAPAPATLLPTAPTPSSPTPTLEAHPACARDGARALVDACLRERARASAAPAFCLRGAPMARAGARRRSRPRTRAGARPGTACRLVRSLESLRHTRTGSRALSGEPHRTHGDLIARLIRQRSAGGRLSAAGGLRPAARRRCRERLAHRGDHRLAAREYRVAQRIRDAGGRVRPTGVRMGVIVYPCGRDPVASRQGELGGHGSAAEHCRA